MWRRDLARDRRGKPAVEGRQSKRTETDQKAAFPCCQKDSRVSGEVAEQGVGAADGGLGDFGATQYKQRDIRCASHTVGEFTGGMAPL